MRPKFSRTRARIFGIVSMFMCVMWGLALLWTWTERKSVIESSSTNLVQLRSAIDEQTQGLFRVIELSLYSSERWISAHPDSEPSSSEEFISLLDGFRRLSDYAIDIKIISPSGRLENIPNVVGAAEINLSSRDYFKAQFNDKTRGFYIGTPALIPNIEKWILPVSIPVTSPSEHAAVVFATVDLEKINNRLEKSRIKPKGTIIVTTNEGMIIFRAPFDEKIIGKSLSAHPDFALCIENEKGTCITDSSTTDGIKRLLSFSKSANFPIIVAVSSALEDILEPWKKQTIVIIMICFLVSCVVMFLWLQLIKSLKAKEATRSRLEYLSNVDSLTGLSNRRAFLEILKSEIERSRRYSRFLSILVLDLDHFKKINDTHGHAAGDEMLKAFGDMIEKTLRGIDLAGRLGGEEFCVLLPETAKKSAMDVAERIRHDFSKLRIKSGDNEISTTVSIGVAELGEADISIETIMERADKGLYKAKQLGRNRVESL